MKRHLIFISFVCFFVTIVYSQSVTINGIRYSTNGDNDATCCVDPILRYGLTKADVIGLVTISGKDYNVKSIASCGFENCKNLVSITLPYGLKEIGERAFKGCIYNHRTTKTNQKYPSVNL